MKTILLLFTGMLLSINTVTATNLSSKDNGLDITKRYRFAQPIVFVERGIEFFIFPDGSFDFNTNYVENTRRNNVNSNYNGQRGSSSRSIKTNIARDRNGTIRSINNVLLNYDKFGKVTKIGNVFMDYDHGKKGTLTQVGNLKVNYNRWGEIVATRGFVNQENRFATYIIRNQNDFAHNNNRFDNDDNYYYFKQNGKIKKQKKR